MLTVFHWLLVHVIISKCSSLLCVFLAPFSELLFIKNILNTFSSKTCSYAHYFPTYYLSTMPSSDMDCCGTCFNFIRISALDLHSPLCRGSSTNAVCVCVSL
eukprot:scpid114885/ scgid22314/ 